MSTSRRFLLASSLTRLVQKERGGQTVVEGYFPERGGRSSCVRLAGRSTSLVLISPGPDGPIEEQAEIPRAHAEALLAVTAGEAEFSCTALSIGPREIRIMRFIRPGPLDIIDVAFERDEEARDFQPPAWFGPEVSADARYRNQSIALEGAPEPLEVPLTNQALDSLLDTLENRAVSRRHEHSSRAKPLLKAEATLAEDTSLDEDEVRELAHSLRPQRR